MLMWPHSAVSPDALMLAGEHKQEVMPPVHRLYGDCANGRGHGDYLKCLTTTVGTSAGVWLKKEAVSEVKASE